MEIIDMKIARLYVTIIFVLLICGHLIYPDQKTEEKKTEIKYGALVPWVMSSGTEPSSFPLYKPYSLTIDSEGNVYVLDVGNSCIVKYNKNGLFIKNWGHEGQGPGELGISPASAIRFDKNENLAVTERQFNQRITFFDKDGNYLSSFRTEHPADSISFDSKNNTFISISGSTNNDNLIIKYDHNGNILDKFGKVFIEGMNPDYHESILVHDNDDNLYQIFTHFPYIRKYDSNNHLIFQKEIDLSGDFNTESVKIWHNYNFSSPSNKFGDNWMLFCTKAIFSSNSIFLLKLGSIINISTDGKYISKKILETETSKKYGFLFDFCVTLKGDIYTTFIGKENVGIGLFIY